MRFIFKTSYAQDIQLAKLAGQVFWYGLLLLLRWRYYYLRGLRRRWLLQQGQLPHNFCQILNLQ